MKNCNSINALYISYDGALDPLGQSQIIPYLKKLAVRDAQITLVSFDKAKYLNQDTFRKIKQELSDSKIVWSMLNYHKNPLIIAKIYDIFVGLIRCSVILSKDKFSIVHGRSFVGAFIGMLLSRMFNIKFLLDYRGLWPDERADSNAISRNTYLFHFLKYIEKCLILSADEIVVLTKRAKAVIKEFSYSSHLKAKIYVIPTCTDLEHFKPLYKVTRPEIKKGLNIMYLGSVGTWYMLEEMADFFVELKQQIPDSIFSFVSPAPAEMIQSVMRRKPLPQSCYSTKRVAYSEVPYWLNTADLSIFFIKPVYSKISSCPTKLGESLACGIPVIINSGVGDCDQIVTGNNVGVVVDDFSKKAYKKATKKIMKLLDSRESCKQRCRQVAEDYFSLENGIELYSQIYNQIGRNS